MSNQQSLRSWLREGVTLSRLFIGVTTFVASVGFGLFTAVMRGTLVRADSSSTLYPDPFVEQQMEGAANPVAFGWFSWVAYLGDSNQLVIETNPCDRRLAPLPAAKKGATVLRTSPTTGGLKAIFPLEGRDPKRVLYENIADVVGPTTVEEVQK